MLQKVSRVQVAKRMKKLNCLEFQSSSGCRETSSIENIFHTASNICSAWSLICWEIKEFEVLKLF